MKADKLLTFASDVFRSAAPGFVNGALLDSRINCIDIS